MATTVKDERYLCVSAYVRALETRLLTAADLDRMLEGSTEDALRMLSDHGYPPMEPVISQLEQALRESKERLFADLEPMLPRQELLDLFRTGYDFHNIKVALKAQWTGVDGGSLLMGGGTMDPQALYHTLQTGEEADLSDSLTQVIQQVRETVAATGDPQKGDVLLDRACFDRRLQLAQTLESPFPLGYVRLLIDNANLQAAVRVLRMGKDPDLLAGILAPGGTVPPDDLLESARAGDLTAPWLAGPLEQAAQLGRDALEGKGLTPFEKACDDACTHYLQNAALIPYGPGPVLAFLAAWEQEGRNIRIILSGKLAGLDADIIRERMREAYV